MSNQHPYHLAPEVPPQYHQSSNTRPGADPHLRSSNVPCAPFQVPGETKPDTDPPPEWPKRPKQKNDSAITDRISPLHDSPIDQGFAFEQPPTTIPPDRHERAHPAQTVQHGYTGSNHIPQQFVGQYSSASVSSPQSSSTTSSGNSGRNTSSKHGRRDDENSGSRVAQTHNVSQDSDWIWSTEHRRYYRWHTNELGQTECKWA